MKGYKMELEQCKTLKEGYKLLDIETNKIWIVAGKYKQLTKSGRFEIPVLFGGRWNKLTDRNCQYVEVIE
jgi:hypothetical protein